MTKSVLTAVAWPYANGPRHIGHVAGFGVPSDVFARYQRMTGANVLMVSGTDEHGTPLLVQAEKEGVTVQELADRYNRQIVHDLAGLGLSYDLFTRTTTRNHYAVVQELFRGCMTTATWSKKQPWALSRHPRVAPCRTATLKAPVPFVAPTRARRSVRQLRQPVGSRRPDQPRV